MNTDQISLRLPYLPSIAVGLEVFLFLAFRVRTFPVIHFVAFLVGWYLIAPRVIISGSSAQLDHFRLSFSQKILLVTLGLVLLLSAFVLRTYRGKMESEVSLSEVSLDVVGSIQYAFERGGELGYSIWVFRILEVVPSTYDYLNGHPARRPAVLPQEVRSEPSSQIVKCSWFPGQNLHWRGHSRRLNVQRCGFQQSEYSQVTCGAFHQPRWGSSFSLQRVTG